MEPPIWFDYYYYMPSNHHSRAISPRLLHSPNEKDKRSLCADSIGRTGSFDDVSKPMCNARGQLMTCIKEICNCHINNSSLLR